MTMPKISSFQTSSVLYQLTMAFALFFMGPLLGLLFLSLKTNLFGTNELAYCLLGLLGSTLFGYVIMRQISSGILQVERRMSEEIDDSSQGEKSSENELENIVNIAEAMSENMRETGQSLNRRIREIHALKELGNITSYQAAPKSLATIALKRSMDVTEARAGVILFVSGNTATCIIKWGRGIKLQKNKQFSLNVFPWRKNVRQNSPIFIENDQSGSWGHFFTDNCTYGAVVPFGRFGNTTGIALLGAGDDHGWDETTLEFLSTYFLSIGNALRMQEINTEKRELSHELKIILSIVRILNANQKESDLLAIISKKIEEIIPYRWIGMAVKEESSQHLYLSHSFSQLAPEVKSGRRIDGERSLFHLAMHSEEIIFVENLISRREYHEKELFLQLGLKSAVFASLNSSGKVIGSICLASDRRGGFGRREKRIFSMVAIGVAMALEQSQVLARERAKRTELEVLNRIGGALSSHTIKANSILHYVLARIAELVEVEAGSIMLLEFDSLVIEAAMGEFSQVLTRQKLQFNHGVAGYVVATGEAVIVDDVRDNPHFLSVVDEKTGFETRSMLCVPLICGGRVIGVIELLNRVGRPFSQDDLQGVKAVAASTAIALENTRLYSESSYIAKKEKFIRTIFQKYVPEEIVAKILECGDADQMRVSESRIVTVFNVDIRGYTRMSRQASTEDVVHILNHFFKKIGNIIIQHKGLLDKYLGDGVLAIFGAPASTANPALDAVKAAMEMIREIDNLSLISEDRCGVPLRIGISINTGEAIVGNIGFSKKMEYTVIGDVVNETFRLQELTRDKPNSILIGETTYSQVKSTVQANPCGMKQLGSTKVNVYEVVCSDEGEWKSDLRQSLPVHDLVTDSGKIH